MVARAIRRLSFTAADLGRAGAFYAALGFVPTGTGPADAEELAALGLPGARAERLRMTLGAQEVEFLAFDPPGRPYPPDSTSTDLWFQHIAIAVGDMREAHRRLMAAGGATPITEGGPQHLPPNTGGVTAFKFRDPDGHPLEFLEFPPGVGDPAWQQSEGDSIFLGIDHTAISVGDVDRSRAYYEGLGFRQSSRSLNRGPEQQRLDGLAGDVADVVGLSLAVPTPHLELLAYRTGLRRSIAASGRPDDIAATRLVLRSEAAGEPPCLLRDPDGHLILMEGLIGCCRSAPD